MKFRGAYACFSSEVERGKRFSSALIKQLTGDDIITARKLYSGMVSFKATWQLVLAVNDLPVFAGDDEAFIDRVLILPFVMRYCSTEEKKERARTKGVDEKYIHEAKDKAELERSITEERAGILKYLIEQYIYLQYTLGGNIPQAAEAKAAKDNFIADNDTFGEWFNANCTVRKGLSYFTTSEAISESFREFTGDKKVSNNTIGRLLTKYDKRITKAVRRVSVYDAASDTHKSKAAKGFDNIILNDEINSSDLQAEPAADENADIFQARLL
jgi:phage/plasmid-associated DNA primase